MRVYRFASFRSIDDIVEVSPHDRLTSQALPRAQRLSAIGLLTYGMRQGQGSCDRGPDSSGSILWSTSVIANLRVGERKKNASPSPWVISFGQ